MTHYPIFVYTLSNGISAIKFVHLVPEDDQEERIGITVTFPCDPYDGYGALKPEARRALIKIGRTEMLRSGLPVCVVFGSNDCAYLKEGSYQDSNTPPRLTNELTAENCDPEVWAQIHAEFTKNEVDVGRRPILPAKRNELIF